ncbi:hypothetical protein DIZ76_013579 [Coccidioides immitis]|nr:hypothetical protein DIZ76_013579 [Coccidioides immitis]
MDVVWRGPKYSGLGSYVSVHRYNQKLKSPDQKAEIEAWMQNSGPGGNTDTQVDPMLQTKTADSQWGLGGSVDRTEAIWREGVTSLDEDGVEGSAAQSGLSQTLFESDN